jgi:nucleotide-binding universal stress UspA family protein
MRRSVIEINNILCPVDFSDLSRRALDHAVAVAKWYSAHLTLLYVHVVPKAALPSFAPEPEALVSPARAQLQQTLEGWAEEAAKGMSVDCLVNEGSVADEIVVEAESADMLVMGTHGRSGFDHLVLGSVAEKVLRKANCPVLTIPRAAADATAAVPGLFHHIVAAVDFSDASQQAFAFAMSIAEEADAHLTALHVVDLPEAVETWIVDSPEGRGRLEQWKQGTLSRLRELVPDDIRPYCHVEERVEEGKPYREILRVADERSAGLIVIGAHGRGIVEQAFVGSTAQHIVRQAVCPVLTVRPG